jgi:hypothetical protein
MTKPLKESELRKHAVCACCRRKIGESGLPLFYLVSIERHGVKMDAVDRQTGLEQILGGCASIAQAMGPDEDMTGVLMERATITVCERCSTENVMVARLAELAIEQAEKENEAEPA